MLTIIGVILILALIGALFAGGEGFGDSIRKGCGCVVFAVVGLIILMLVLLI
ncbi:hypothetical protein [Porphyromonas sp. COT-239 OH1446]|uniref:hypothetical protein n=1 Tax=Porphyromonas sp. COT-239 OH1446 TaxID=1515613 RepID=UPI001362B820|nr:hypothetical protein [Porphyromonas sp. COT-239 OH1446]